MAVHVLTVKERILLHLFDFSRHAGEYEVPLDLTQSGIAKAVRIRVQHATQYLRPLIADGLVEEKTSHIQHQPRRRKAYFLTGPGKQQVATQRSSLMKDVVPFRLTRGKTKEALLEEVYQRERRKSTLLQLMMELEEFGHISEPLQEVEDAETVDFTQGAPAIGHFYGREDELQGVLEALERFPLVTVTGIAGIGKTTLGSRVCEVLRGTRSLFWHRIRAWDTVEDLALRLGAFLRAAGRGRLYAYLTGPGSKTLSQIEAVLASDLQGVNSLLVFDDVQEVAHDVEPFLAMLHSVLRDLDGPTNALLLSRVDPGFYGRREVLVDGSVAEFSLEGLEPRDCRALLVEADVAEDMLDDLTQLSGGSPLFLQLLTRGSPQQGQGTGASALEAYIGEEIEPTLSDEDRSCLQVASMYQVDVPPEGLLLEGSRGMATVVGLLRKGLLRRSRGESILVHDLIRKYFRRGLSEEREMAVVDRVAPWMLREAKRLGEEREYEDAIAFAKNARAIERNKDRLAKILAYLGRMSWFVADLEGALSYYGEALDLTREPESQARLHRIRADLLAGGGRYEEAKTEVEAGLQLAGQPSVEAAWLHLTQAYAAIIQKDSERAAEDLQRVAEWIPSLPEDLNLSGKLALHSGMLHIEDDPALALSEFKEAVELFQAADNYVMIGWALNSMASAAFLLGRDEEGLRYFDESIARAEKDGFLTGRLRALHDKSHFLITFVGDFAAAEAVLEETVELAKLYDPRYRLNWHYSDFAGLYYWQDRIEEARESQGYFLDVASAMVEDSIPLEDWIVALSFMVRLCLLAGDDEAAKAYMRQAEEVASRSPTEKASLSMDWTRGLLHAHLGERDRAESSLLQAIEGSQPGYQEHGYAARNSPYKHRASLLLDYAHLLASLGREVEARDVLQKAFAEATEWPFEPVRVAVEEAIASLEKPKGTS